MFCKALGVPMVFCLAPNLHSLFAFNCSRVLLKNIMSTLTLLHFDSFDPMCFILNYFDYYMHYKVGLKEFL